MGLKRERRTLIPSDLISYYINKGDYAKAEQLLKDELTRDPENALLHGQLALVYIDTKKSKLAKRELEIALTANPEFAWFHYLLYRYFLLLDNAFKARNAIRNALALEPEDAGYHVALAQLDLALHFYDTALQYAEKGLAIDPEHLGCMHVRTEALRKMGRKKQAAHSLDQTIHEHPEDDYTHESAGYMQLKQKNYHKAEEHFRYALSKNPNNARARQGYLESLRARYLIYRVMSAISTGFIEIYSQYYYILLVVLMMVVKVTETSLDDVRQQQFYSVHVAFITMLVLTLPVWIYPLLNAFNLMRGVGGLVYEPHEIRQARFSMLMMVLAAAALLLSIFMPLVYTCIGFTLLSFVHLGYGIFGPPLRYSWFTKSFSVALLLYGCFCAGYIYSGQPFQVLYVIYLVGMTCLPALVVQVHKRVVAG